MKSVNTFGIGNLMMAPGGQKYLDIRLTFGFGFGFRSDGFNLG